MHARILLQAVNSVAAKVNQHIMRILLLLAVLAACLAHLAAAGRGNGVLPAPRQWDGLTRAKAGEQQTAYVTVVLLRHLRGRCRRLSWSPAGALVSCFPT